MQKRPFLKLLFVVLLAIGIVSVKPISASAASDHDDDGYITYADLNTEQRNELLSGHSLGLNSEDYGYSMMFNLKQPYIKDVYLNTSTNPSYNTQASRTKAYYQHIRYDKNLYSVDSLNWVVVQSYSHDGKNEAIVNCTAPYNKLITPETIYDKNGKKCEVVGIELTNYFVTELTITDNIQYIYKCQCPMLETINGGINVISIGNLAFRDNIYMTNLPYFPKLESIGRMAFLGCFNLKEVLLPPLISGMFADSFGWYDVILGNYDFDVAEKLDASMGSDLYADKYKIKGITLYYTQNTATSETLEKLYKSDKNSFLDLKTKDKYPGKQGPVEIEDEKRYIEWSVPVDEIPPEEWVRIGNEITPTDPVKVTNSVTANQKQVLDWLSEIYIDGEIETDVYIAVICSLAGLNSIPTVFIEQYIHDKHLADLLEVVKDYVKIGAKIVEADKQALYEVGSQLNDLQIKAAIRFLNYSINGTPIKDHIISGAQTVLLNEDFIKLCRLLDNVKNSLNFQQALQIAGLDSAITGKICAAYQPVVSFFEECSYVILSNTKGFLISTAKASVTDVRFSLLSDLVYNSFYDAWLNSSNSPDKDKWTLFASAFHKNLDVVLENAQKNCQYYGGSARANTKKILDILDYVMQPGVFQQILDYYAESFAKDASICSDWMSKTYNEVISDISFKSFSTVCKDYIISYYVPGYDLIMIAYDTLTMENRGTLRD